MLKEPLIIGTKITFNNKQGDALAALLEQPESAADLKGYALFAHCFTCSKNSSAATRISHALAKKGFGVVRFDFTGLGNSEGDFANTNFSSNVEDLISVADHLRAEKHAPTILIGHSLGGAAVLAAASQIPEAKAIVTIASPGEPSHVAHLFSSETQKIEEHGSAIIDLAGRKFEIKKQFLEDIREQTLKPKITSLGKALLIFHSPTDTIFGIEQARYIYEAAKHPKSFISLDHADHLLSRKDYA